MAKKDNNFRSMIFEIDLSSVSKKHNSMLVKKMDCDGI